MPDINTWIKQLSAKPLPVLSHTREQLLQLMKNENLSLGVYAGPVLRDPAMAVVLLKDVNKAKVTQGRDAIGTLSNAMPHLGPAKIKQHVNKAVLLDDLTLSPKHLDGYMRYVTQACHGAFQARDWGMQRQTIEPEEMELAALLQNITELALWCYGDDAMPRIEHLVYVEKQEYEKAAKEVLGCGIRLLGAKLAKAWFLPELSALALASNYAGFTLATGVALASRLARLSTYGWYNRETLKCVQNIAEYQGHSIADTEHLLHLNAVYFSDYLPQFSQWTPAKLLPMLADEQYIDRAFVWGDVKPAVETKVVNEAKIQAEKIIEKSSQNKISTPKQAAKTTTERSQKTPAVHKEITKKTPLKSAAELKSALQKNMAPPQSAAIETKAEKNKKTIEAVTPKTETATSSYDAEEMARQVSLLQRMIKKKDSVPHIIQQAVDATQTLGFDRVSFVIKVPKKEELVTKFFSQDKAAHELKPFKIMLDKPHVFTLLMSKPQNIWLHEKNKTKYWGLIPANVKLALHNDTFFAMSIFVNQKPVGLMYADKPAGKLTAGDYKRFQGLCNMLSKGLADIVQKPAAKKEA